MGCINSVLLLWLKLFVHRKNIGRKYTKMRTSLEVQWLRFRGHGFDPCLGTEIPHALEQLSMCATVTEAHLPSPCSTTAMGSLRTATRE